MNHKKYKKIKKNKSLRILPQERFFLESILKIKNIKILQKVFLDLLTQKEYKQLINRITTISLLEKGIPYRKILQIIDINNHSISRLNFHRKKGYGGIRYIINSKNRESKKLDKKLLKLYGPTKKHSKLWSIFFRSKNQSTYRSN